MRVPVPKLVPVLRVTAYYIASPGIRPNHEYYLVAAF